MEKTYNPQQIEQYWSAFWHQQNYAKPKAQGQPYCIMLPPPNVTGSLHMGHGFQQTLMDTLIRYQRMSNKSTHWQAGTDHAGIATQMVVERQLISNNQTRHDLGRSAFIEKVWQWRKQSGDHILGQMQRLGTSIDWSNSRFTMDETISKATIEAFNLLHKEGLIYRGKRLVNWDPELLTAISDLEVESEKMNGNLWHIRYPLANSDEFIVVATTRPETMLGDVAVAVHPKDTRYQNLVGKQIRLPLTDRLIPIIADDYVEREFGSGCVKITPAHDFNDYQMGKRHDLPLINIFTPKAKINEHAAQAYQGLDRFEARKKIVADLEKAGLLEKVEPHEISVPRGDRSGAIIEPYLTDQWFIKMKLLAEPAIAAIRDGSLKFVPEKWSKTYLQWLENIEDWCISRQLWWGHQIPVWHDDQGKHYVGHNEMDVRQRFNLIDQPLKQDEDVLDTWFSAALWPFATLGWPEQTEAFKTFYPTNVLITGFDIIFFWVARMVMMGLKFTGEVPFKEVYITGLIRDRHGKKMSKTKGNVLDPIDLIDGISLEDLVAKRTQSLMQPHMKKSVEKATRQEFPKGIASYGTDALRFTFCALATTGRDINFDMGRIEGYRNFCNKIWNAARYVLMNTEGQDIDNEKAIEYTMADRWIRSQLQSVIKQVQQYFSEYRFDLLAQALYDFVWNEYCGWYLEFAKSDLNNPEITKPKRRGTQLTLLSVLETSLRLLQPIMPFITEEIWQKVAAAVGQEKPSIMVSSYPEYDDTEKNQPAELAINWVKQVITAIRSIRSEMGINPGKKIPVILAKGQNKDHEYANQLKPYIASLAKVNDIRWANADTNLQATATSVVNQLEIHIPLADLIDKNAELLRLNKEIEKLKKELKKSEAKLNNPNYVNKAPKEVVAAEQNRLKQTQMAMQKLEQQYKNISSL